MCAHEDLFVCVDVCAHDDVHVREAVCVCVHEHVFVFSKDVCARTRGCNHKYTYARPRHGHAAKTIVLHQAAIIGPGRRVWPNARSGGR